MAKLNHCVHGYGLPTMLIVAALVQESPKSAPARVKTAPPPIQLWMPNQPQAMKARSRAGTLEPKTPNEARARTGYGIPYLVPPWLFNSMGTRTIRLPSAIVITAWYHPIPRAIRPEASR